MKTTFSKVAAVTAGAVVLTGLGSVGVATAGQLIGSPQIKDESIKSKDIRDGQVRASDLNGKVNKSIERAAASGIQHAAGQDTVIENIGGSISDRFTKVEGAELTLGKGTYVFTLSGAFISDTAAAADSAPVYPQVSLWLDKNNNDEFEWRDDEGSISPNALMPTAKDRHVSASGTTVITLDKKTTVKVLAFGYAGDTSAARSGEIKAVDVSLVAERTEVPVAPAEPAPAE